MDNGRPVAALVDARRRIRGGGGRAGRPFGRRPDARRLQAARRTPRMPGSTSAPARTASSSTRRPPTARAKPCSTRTTCSPRTRTRTPNGADADLAMIVVLRHFATAFAFTDVVWAKYGKPMSAMLGFADPKTKEAPSTNLYNAAGYGLSLTNLGATIDARHQARRLLRRLRHGDPLHRRRRSPRPSRATPPRSTRTSRRT